MFDHGTEILVQDTPRDCRTIWSYACYSIGPFFFLTFTGRPEFARLSKRSTEYGVQRFNQCILTHLQRFPPAVDPSMLRGAVCITPYYVIAHLLLLRTQSVLVRALILFPSFVVIIQLRV